MLNHAEKPHHTFMYLWIVGALFVLIAGMAAYALNYPRTVEAPTIVETATTTDHVASPVDTETSGVFTLALSEKGESHGWAITPLSVVEDSRCPVDVQCIQAGTVRVSVQIANATTTERTLTALTRTPVPGGFVTLLQVNPTPKASTPIQKGDYRFTFLVEKQ